ncbi:hypothetical protein [Streptococcus suis]|uniref:hypothetical protein n=2 Tax=Streptococcus suis TaxID=1307 RepID=UPI00241229EC|nr:hypothetical protein [Streptococcus suis]
MKLGQIDLQMCKDFDIIQRCWIRRPTAIIVFQKPLSVCWGLFLLPEFQKNSVFSKFDRKILTFISDVFKNCRFCGQKKTLSRGLEHSQRIFNTFFNTFFTDY